MSASSALQGQRVTYFCAPGYRSSTNSESFNVACNFQNDNTLAFAAPSNTCSAINEEPACQYGCAPDFFGRKCNLDGTSLPVNLIDYWPLTLEESDDLIAIGFNGLQLSTTTTGYKPMFTQFTSMAPILRIPDATDTRLVVNLLNSMTTLTVSVWVKFDRELLGRRTTSETTYPLFVMENSGTGATAEVYVSPLNKNWVYISSTNEAFDISSTSTTMTGMDDAGTLITVTLTGTSIYMMRGDSETGPTVTVPSIGTISNIYLGSSPAARTGTNNLLDFNGWMACFSVTNNAISNTELESLYNSCQLFKASPNSQSLFFI